MAAPYSIAFCAEVYALLADAAEADVFDAELCCARTGEMTNGFALLDSAFVP